MSNAPEALVILVPDEIAVDPNRDDAEIARLIGGPANAGSTGTDRGETRRIYLPIAGEPIWLDVAPQSILGLVIDRYCAAGWPAVNELAQALLATAVDPVAMPQSAPFIRALVDASALLEQLVSEAIMRIAAEALQLATLRVADLKAHLEQQVRRYGIKAPGTKAPEGAGGRSGTDNASPVNKEPVVEVGGDSAMAEALAAAVRKLIAAQNDLVAERQYQNRVSKRQDGVEGPRSGNATSAADPVADNGNTGGGAGRDPDAATSRKRMETYKKEFVELCGRTAMGPLGHTIAPPVFALLRRSEAHYVDEAMSNQAIWSKAFVYLRDAQASVSRALPQAYPFHSLRDRLSLSIAAAATERPGDAIDRPELRAVLWGSERGRGYGYEPLDDEAVLMKLQTKLAQDLASGDDPDSLQACFRYRVLVELIAARDMRDRIVALKKKAAEAGPLAEFDRAAGLLGLLGLAFPALELPAAGLGLYAAAGHALEAMREVDRETREIDAGEIAALVAADWERYADLVASRPSVTGIAAKILGEVAAFEVIGKLSRPVGAGLQAWFDFVAVEPNAEKWVVGDWTP